MALPRWLHLVQHRARALRPRGWIPTRGAALEGSAGLPQRDGIRIPEHGHPGFQCFAACAAAPSWHNGDTARRKGRPRQKIRQAKDPRLRPDPRGKRRSCSG